MDKALKKKIDLALQRIEIFAPKTEPYYVCYSGGKDSDCIRLLCDMWGGEYELHNNHTTVDAPETVYYIRKVMSTYGERQTIYEDGHRIHKYGESGFIHFPVDNMWRLIIKKGFPPTRLIRFCCEKLKESGGKGRVAMTGVRWAESKNRKDNQGLVSFMGKSKRLVKKLEENDVHFELNKKGGVVLNTDNSESRRAVEICYRTSKTLVNPIIDWTEEDVWDFLKSRGCESNPLYKCGWRRVGCIGCPMSGPQGMKKEFSLYPRYKNLYIKTFDKMLEQNEKDARKNKLGLQNGTEVYKWWVMDDPKQITFEEYYDEIGEEW